MMEGEQHVVVAVRSQTQQRGDCDDVEHHQMRREQRAIQIGQKIRQDEDQGNGAGHGEATREQFDPGECCAEMLFSCAGGLHQPCDMRLENTVEAKIMYDIGH